MTRKLFALAPLALAIFGLGGCLASDAERGLAGAAGGAVLSDVTGAAR